MRLKIMRKEKFDLELKGRTLLYTAIILLSAVYLRLRCIFFTPFEFKIDAFSMYHYALNVTKGKYYGHCFGEHWARYAYWPPFYIFFSGFIYRILGTKQDFIAMRTIQACFSSVSCLLCCYIAAEAIKSYSSFYNEAGLAAGILMALNPRMVIYTNHLYVETVFITIYLALVYFALRYMKYELPLKLNCRKGYVPVKHLLLFSFLLGIGNLTRPVLLLLPGVMIVVALLYTAANKRDIKGFFKIISADAAFAAVIMLLVFSPWIIRNYAVTGRFILIDTNGPINLYIAHNPRANGQWVDVKPYTDIDRLYDTGYKEGLVYISKNIPREISLARLKQRLFLYHGDPHVSEAEYHLNKTYKLPFYGGPEGLYRLPRMSFEFLWKTTLILMVLFIIRLIAAKAFFILFCEPFWIIGNLLYVNLIIQIFYFAPRYRIIAEPFLCIASGVFLAGILSPSIKPPNLSD